MRNIRFQDDEIEHLLKQPKQLPLRWERRLVQMRSKPEVSQRRSDLMIKSDGGEFRIMVRQSTINYLDFSVIVAFRTKQDSTWFKLRRYNGEHPGPHRNRIENPKQTINGFHIHTASARYQQRGADEEGYAVETTAAADVNSAIEFALRDCNFQKPSTQPDNPSQLRLWKRGSRGE